MDSPQILLVNPPIYDFTAYDFWLRPYGMLRVAGRMRHAARLTLFDYLTSDRRDPWGRGKFSSSIVAKPVQFRDIPRYFRRFGRPRVEFRRMLGEKRFDAVLVQTMMSYWYPGVSEVIDDLRALQPAAKVVLGGVYATLCPSHAARLGADLVVEGSNLEPLWRLLSITPRDALPFWQPPLGDVGVLKLTDGCPFRCTYCSVPIVAPEFEGRPTDLCLEELQQLIRLGARHVAFYDDALLFRSEQILVPFLQGVIGAKLPVCFHTPNALNARFITPEIARRMLQAGFSSFFLGLESNAYAWQRATGGKVYSEEFSTAVRNLKAAGAPSLAAYIIVGHPDSNAQELESSIRFAHEAGTRVLLAEFSPIPGTADGERCREWADLEEPLAHNKTAFTIRRLGTERINQLKALTRDLNRLA